METVELNRNQLEEIKKRAEELEHLCEIYYKDIPYNCLKTHLMVGMQMFSSDLLSKINYEERIFLFVNLLCSQVRGILKVRK